MLPHYQKPLAALRFTVLWATMILSSDAKVGKLEFLKPGTQPNDIGGILYDPYMEMCCEGQIHPTKAYSSSQYCCGNQTFNYRTHICCWKEKVIQPRLNGAFSQCCGGKAYDKSKKVCCRETHSTADIPDGISEADAVYYRCCKNTAYDKRNQICCDGRLQQKWSEHSACCVKEQYDRRNSVCCNKKVMGNKGLGHQAKCCKDRIYDMSTQLCCNDTVVDIERGLTACCGTKGYGKIKELCCNGKILARKSYGLTHKCCGTSTYDSAKELCCEGSVVKRRSFRTSCCGKSAIELDLQVCCDSTMQKRDNMFTRCCLTQSYDTRREVCCGGKVMKKGRDTKDTCCAKDIRSHLHRRIECKEIGDDLEDNDEML